MEYRVFTLDGLFKFSMNFQRDEGISIKSEVRACRYRIHALVTASICVFRYLFILNLFFHAETVGLSSFTPG